MVKSEASPDPRARITGLFYLLYFLTAILGAYLDGRKLVTYSFVVNFISIALYITVTLLFYYLFKPVSRNLSLIAALFSFAGCAATALSLFHPAWSIISPLIFFGPYCLLMGYLIFKSSFLPRILGILMAVAGIGWLVFLSPLGNYLSTYIKVAGILGEGFLMLWLLVMGVNTQRWMERAAGKIEN